MFYRKTVSTRDDASSASKRPFLDDDDQPNEKVETEAEKQMKILLQKQLNTKISIKDQFAQHRTFTSPSTYNSLSELVQGACTLDRFKEIEKDEELHQELQQCGLTEKEISDYLLHKSRRERNMKIDPFVWDDKIKRIEEKIKTHNDFLLKPQFFSNVKKLTRHEMDIEKSLYAGLSEKNQLSALLSVAADKHPPDVDSAFKHVKVLSEVLTKNYKKRKQKNEQPDDNQCTHFQFDPNIHHAVVPLNKEEINEKRLTIDEIKQIQRFKNYEAGTPSKTLYLKNLHPKITINELRSVFGIFEEENRIPVDYKLCTGRMKGQAFVHFSGVGTSEKAFNHANGCVLRGKPIIIQYGHKKVD